MKLNLLLNSSNVRSGYINIDSLGNPQNSEIKVGDIGNLDWVAVDAEVEDLLALDVIDYMPSSQINDILDNWLKKLRHGGTITVGGVDNREVAKALMSQRISIDEVNQLLYGFQRAPWEYRKATLTIQHIINVLKSHGFQIMRKDTRNFHYYVTAKRP